MAELFIGQGIGAATMEEYVYDADGTLGTPTFREYLIPSMSEAPPMRIEHEQTPSPWTEFGVKGSGEGGRLIAAALLGTTRLIDNSAFRLALAQAARARALSQAHLAQVRRNLLGY